MKIHYAEPENTEGKDTKKNNLYHKIHLSMNQYAQNEKWKSIKSIFLCGIEEKGTFQDQELVKNNTSICAILFILQKKCIGVMMVV